MPRLRFGISPNRNDVMKRLLWLSAISITFFLSVPGPPARMRNPPGNRGFSCWEACALRWNAWIHFHGPLYSYGPYCGQGYAYMFVPQPFCGTYLPAYPAAYYGYPTPNATINGFHSWNGTGTELGYPTALNAPALLISTRQSSTIHRHPLPPPQNTTMVLLHRVISRNCRQARFDDSPAGYDRKSVQICLPIHRPLCHAPFSRLHLALSSFVGNSTLGCFLSHSAGSAPDLTDWNLAEISYV